MKRPNKADRTFVARHLRREAAGLRETVQRNRLSALADHRPDIGDYWSKLAGKQETRAERFGPIVGYVVHLVCPILTALTRLHE